MPDWGGSRCCGDEDLLLLALQLCVGAGAAADSGESSEEAPNQDVGRADWAGGAIVFSSTGGVRDLVLCGKRNI